MDHICCLALLFHVLQGDKFRRENFNTNELNSLNNYRREVLEIFSTYFTTMCTITKEISVTDL